MTVVEDYQAQTEALAAGTAAQVLAAAAAVHAGTFTAAEAVVVIAAAVNMANAAAASLADAFVAARIEAATGVPTPAVGLPPADDFDRLAQAVGTVFGDLPQTAGAEPSAQDTAGNEPADTAATRLERLARSEPLQAAQDHAVEVMAAQPRVIGWRRVLDADPCELCVWLYANGRIYKPTTRFRQHPNCNCAAEPVIDTKEKQSA